jgi:hypothetical protein
MAKFNPLDARPHFKSRMFLTLGLRRKPIQLSCEHCGKLTASDMEWVCGFCDVENHRTKLYSFLFKCEQCKQPPKCLQCPHCKTVMFFGKSRDTRHTARKTQSPTSPETEEQIQAKRAREREDSKAQVEHEITLTRLNAELTKLKKSIEDTMESGKKKTPHESLEESFTEHDAQVMAAYKIAKREKEANQKKYADDPELLEMANESIQDWLEKKL